MKKNKCAHCGFEWETQQMIVSIEEDEAVLFCPKCAQLFGQCPFCEHSSACGFQNDPDPMPQFVVVARRIQQGGATFVEQRQIPNPERIKKFCTNGKCKCFLDDLEHPLCCRFGGCATCTNYCEKKYEKFVENFSMQDESKN